MTPPRNRQLDPISIEILWARLISIVDAAAATFARVSFSTLVREANDYAVVLSDAQGRSIAQSTKSIPSFICTLPATIRGFLKDYPAESLVEGDVLITNDPWLGTGHVDDVSIAVPLFHRGRLVGFGAVATHLPDIGGRLRAAGNREIYEEGIQIPPIKLFSAGERNETLFRMLARNVRVPEQSIGDVLGAVAGCRELGIRLSELLDAEGFALAELARAVQDRSEAAMRAAIRTVPDGTYRHVLHQDGVDEPVLIDCKLTVAGDRIDIDYAGSSPQSSRSINVVPSYTFAYSAYAIKALLAPDVPNNEGSFLPLSTTAPEGSILAPLYPAATGARAMVGHMLPTAILMALAPVLGRRAGAEGTPNGSFTMTGQHRGERYAVVNFINGGQGATAARPGHHVLSFPSNLGNTPVEVMESLAPILVRHRRRRRNSGGRGHHRGGDGQAVKFTFRGEQSAVCAFIVNRRRVPPAGALGGEAGRPAALKINGRSLDPSEHRVIAPGDDVEVLTAGGGGFGAPGSAAE